MSKVIHFPVAQKNEISKSISADIVKEAHAPVAGENVVQFGVQRPRAINVEKSLWWIIHRDQSVCFRFRGRIPVLY